MTETISLGCRLNIAESDAIAASLGTRDDLIVVNSCAVTNDAVRRTRQAIRRAHKRRPDARIVVTGCAAQIAPQHFAEMPEVTRVIGNAEKADASLYPRPASASPELVEGRASGGDFSAAEHRPSTGSGLTALSLETEAKIRVSDIMAVRETAPHLAASFSDRARAFVEVQNGCDHRCTFCIIPYGRGNSRSVPAGAVVDRVKALVDDGFAEIVLTGVDVTSFGADLPGTQNLGQLVERILAAVPKLPRLRLSSLDGIEVDDRLFALLTQEPRVMPHIHLSLQAGDDMILKRMKRRHSRAQAIDLVQRLKAARPEIAVGADIIAGFPTETEAMFQNSLRIVEECEIVHGHIFPYSARTGTPAARMPQVNGTAIKQRAAQLRQAVECRRATWLGSLIGSVQPVVVEKDGHGHAPNFARLRVPKDKQSRIGSIVPLRVTDIDNETLIGEAA
ncbi:tRNA (N(6)-L-threonylcarbamoyladenosine(37)-C(2))-methylthiotransferase MtaB [Novosphingopyxis sp. YJ-S2-01]|uniref:tRNA (N(6)-L-threonylcarbamoyladenosine(37)-C(2))- methylthiotransferase MtaB n=1 Tax=Novosphingopyxis sp. YJ-S2-01 TaxID=2794021 RepID=UPI0018DBF300|nr:tRNA (N(6)-L-threonylcarbamoyladenosine(37)-C(2))-methylthiotransferase MtaB [Novosphingopyxis sp. YJ-S2-01]MBH9537847.1 tRNA (N(6)-L-threonylcarbamoyladenosine(37)-C(2))-methylthiotransferase MtaB [Novosphingopyxis sp. YJ-S2-01]